MNRIKPLPTKDDYKALADDLGRALQGARDDLWQINIDDDANRFDERIEQADKALAKWKELRS